MTIGQLKILVSFVLSVFSEAQDIIIMYHTNVGALRFYWTFVPITEKEDGNIKCLIKVGQCKL